MVNRISSERKVKRNFGTSKCECFEGLLGDVLRTSWGRLESISQGRPLNVRLGRPLDVISGRPLDVRSGRPQDVRSGRPRDGQIGSLGDVLGTLVEDVLGRPWGPIFAGWDSLVKSTGTNTRLSISSLSNSVFKLAKFDFSAKLEVSLPVTSFKSSFVV